MSATRAGILGCAALAAAKKYQHKSGSIWIVTVVYTRYCGLCLTDLFTQDTVVLYYGCKFRKEDNELGPDLPATFRPLAPPVRSSPRFLRRTVAGGESRPTLWLYLRQLSRPLSSVPSESAAEVLPDYPQRPSILTQAGSGS